MIVVNCLFRLSSGTWLFHLPDHLCLYPVYMTIAKQKTVAHAQNLWCFIGFHSLAFYWQNVENRKVFKRFPHGNTPPPG